MPLSDVEYTQLQSILQGLEGELPRLYSSAQNFVRDQIEREKQYGQDMRLSPKQWKWLRDLYSEKVAVLPGTTAGKMSDEEASRGDLDDEIPF